jgi:hypothetical protein
MLKLLVNLSESCAAAPHDTKRQYKVQHARLREAVRPQRSTSFRTANHGQLGKAIPGRGPLVLSNNDPKGTGRIREETAQRGQDGLERKQPRGDGLDWEGRSPTRLDSQGTKGYLRTVLYGLV